MNIVGLIGGIVGEILTTILTLEELKEDENYNHFKMINLTSDQVIILFENSL